MSGSLVDVAQAHFDAVEHARYRFYKRPIMNGPLGERGLWLAYLKASDFNTGSFLCAVIDPVSGCPVGAGHTMAEALACARQIVIRDDFNAYIEECRRIHFEREAYINDVLAKGETNHLLNEERDAAKDEASVPKRRKQIFNKSRGQCHYCGVKLDIFGEWHIEHMMPRALMGSNKPTNLVASCIPCNLSKRDKTADEFIAGELAI